MKCRGHRNVLPWKFLRRRIPVISCSKWHLSPVAIEIVSDFRFEDCCLQATKHSLLDVIWHAARYFIVISVNHFCIRRRLEENNIDITVVDKFWTLNIFSGTSVAFSWTKAFTIIWVFLKASSNRICLKQALTLCTFSYVFSENWTSSGKIWTRKYKIEGALSWKFCCFPAKTTQKCIFMTFTHAQIFLEM